MGIKRKFCVCAIDAQEEWPEAEWELLDDRSAERVLLVSEKISDRSVAIRLEGSARGDTFSYLKDELMALASADADVTIDCTGLKYFSNSCIKAFIEAQQFMDNIRRGTMTLQNMPADIMSELTASGLAASLMIE